MPVSSNLLSKTLYSKCFRINIESRQSTPEYAHKKFLWVLKGAIRGTDGEADDNLKELLNERFNPFKGGYWLIENQEDIKELEKKYSNSRNNLNVSVK